VFSSALLQRTHGSPSQGRWWFALPHRNRPSAALEMVVGVTSYAARIMQNTEHGPRRRANRFVQDQPP
jgi:hypothetical protein